VLFPFNLTLFLAIFFTFLQGFEYFYSPFSFSDGIFGSCFFFATGFHGLHVIIGTCFLFVALFRLLSGHFSNFHHIGFESAIIY
jgi:heme/copper-type cytochrome/quinol oxidase subunit 3